MDRKIGQGRQRSHSSCVLRPILLDTVAINAYFCASAALLQQLSIFCPFFHLSKICPRILGQIVDKCPLHSRPRQWSLQGSAGPKEGTVPSVTTGKAGEVARNLPDVTCSRLSKICPCRGVNVRRSGVNKTRRSRRDAPPVISLSRYEPKRCRRLPT